MGSFLAFLLCSVIEEYRKKLTFEKNSCFEKSITKKNIKFSQRRNFATVCLLKTVPPEICVLRDKKIQRDFLKTSSSLWMLYRHNAAIGTD